MVSEGESQGRHLDTGGGFTRKHDRRPRTANSRCILDRQRRLANTLRDHVRSASALSALKKVWSPTCPLNGSSHSPNCPLKGFFHSPNGIFSRKWPDGGRFFEPCKRKTVWQRFLGRNVKLCGKIPTNFEDSYCLKCAHHYESCCRTSMKVLDGPTYSPEEVCNPAN